MTGSKPPRTIKYGSKERTPRSVYLRQKQEATRSWLRNNPTVGQWHVLTPPEEVMNIHHRVKCRCTCGEEKLVRLSDLKNGGSRQCRKCADRNNRVLPEASDLEYHASVKRLIKVYKGVVKRCSNSKDKSYPLYGGRGIKCLFASSKDFIEHVLPLPYRPGDSIERIDVNGHYEAGNVKWANQKEQCRNKRTNLQVQGEDLSTIIEELSAQQFTASIRYGVKSGAIRTKEEIIAHIIKNAIRRKTERRVKSLMVARPDFTYESIRSFVKQGLTDEEIISRKKWGGCGKYERKASI